MRELQNDIIKTLSKKTNGMITTAQLEKAGVSRVYIPNLIKEGLLIKEAHGIYYYYDEFPDKLRILQEKSQKLIFSFGTALFLWNLSDRAPHTIDITVPQGYNTARLKNSDPNLRFHYASQKKWEIGITKTRTPNGNLVNLYDKERCIIDLVKAKQKTEKQLYLQALKEYFSDPSANISKLLKYAKLFNQENIIRNYLEIL
ncbi:type IV toxin-antitoxin system AbiEi family antitoxin domain-containing protein [bacterium]|nr:type IV toxin-antitoxin system AbiEi family antitoxin domain-containing protein [bacterium]